MGCVISSWTSFLLVGGEVVRSQHHQPSGSNWSGVYMFVGIIRLTSSTWWRIQSLQNISKDMAQSIIYSSGRGTKVSWLSLVAKLLLFCLTVFLSFCIFFFPIKFVLWLKFVSADKWEVEDMVGGVLFWKGPHWSCLVTPEQAVQASLMLYFLVGKTDNSWWTVNSQFILDYFVITS